MTLAEAQARISSREFAEWEAFYRLEPWGDYRADYRMGVLAAVTTNLWRGKGDKVAHPDDYLPRFGADAARALEQQGAGPPETADEEEAFAQALLSLNRRR